MKRVIEVIESATIKYSKFADKYETYIGVTIVVLDFLFALWLIL